MNLSYDSIRKEKQKYNKLPASHNPRIHGISLFFLAMLCLIIICVISGIWMFHGILEQSSDLTLSTIQANGIPSRIYDDNGILIQELSINESGSEDVLFEQLPENLINAFIASEDPHFWDHNGIDVQTVFRNIFSTLRTGRSVQEASTITLQLVKSNSLPDASKKGFADELRYRLQEQYLAIELEKQMDKKIILQTYLNTVDLGTVYPGVQTASKRYFGKPVTDLSLAECTVLAAICENPSTNSPLSHPQTNNKKRLLILSDMYRLGHITKAEFEEASDMTVYSHILQTSQYEETYSSFSYFTEAVLETVLEDLQEEYGYTASQAQTLLYSGGLEIRTTMDSNIQNIVDEELNNPENYFSSDQSLFVEQALVYSLSIQKTDGTVYSYNENDITNYHKNILDQPAYQNLYTDSEKMQLAVSDFKNYIMQEDDVILSESIRQVMQPQASFVVMDPKTGAVIAISGGRGERSDNLALNRATDLARTPGSAFKVLAVFAPALDTCGANLGTTFYDSPYSIDDRQVMNWWGTQYLGYNNIRQGIKYSMNVIAAKCIQNLVSPSVGFQYLQSFGFSTLSNSDKQASLALGSLEQGVYNLELTAAYNSINDDGIYHSPYFYTQVLDRFGNVLLENEPDSMRILKSSTAALLTEAMKDSISSNGIYNTYGIGPTGEPCQIDNMTVAGTSGSTTDSSDVWFVGYSPYYTCSIWSGYDSSKVLGSNQTFHKVIWQKIMTKLHSEKQDIDFVFSDELEYSLICSKSGLLAIEGVCDAEGSNSITYEETFAKGTSPTEYCNRHYTLRICSVSGQSASIYCPEDDIIQEAFLRIDNSDLNTSVTTLDTTFLAPSGLQSCTVHTVESSIDE